MKLTRISEDGHMVPWPGHPGGAKRHSPLLDPDDRDEFFGGEFVGKKKKKSKKKKLNEAISNLLDELNRIRPQLAAAAQHAYDNRHSDDMGICDEVANELAGAISSMIEGVEIEEGGHDGDDHAYLYVSRGPEKYIVDIPHHLYERGGGYNWTVLPDVVFSPQHVMIEPI